MNEGLCFVKCNLWLVIVFVLVFSALIRKQHTAELHLGDFLVFLRRVVSSKAIQSKMASPKWTEVLLNIAAQKCCSGTTSLCNITQIYCVCGTLSNENIAETLTLGGCSRGPSGGKPENSALGSSCFGGCPACLRGQYGGWPNDTGTPLTLFCASPQ